MAHSLTATILPFKAEDQAEVKNLILAGMGEHFDEINPSLNPDLNDIRASYADAVFLVAWCENRIVGTGALVPRSNGVAKIVRMSVASDLRRQRVGTRILQRLCAEAKHLGLRRIELSTEAAWQEVIVFYKHFGFRITAYHEGKWGRGVTLTLDLLNIDPPNYPE